MASKSSSSKENYGWDDKDILGKGRAPYLKKTGTYFFINPNTTPMDTQPQKDKLSALMRNALTDLRDEGKLEHIWYDKERWGDAVQSVQTKAADGSYACGTTIGPGFFDTDKMSFTVNYIILFVSAKGGDKGGSENSANGFVVLRDLSRMDDIKNLLINPDQPTTHQKNYGPNLENHAYLKNIIKKKKEPYIYIEGLCVNGKMPSVPKGTAVTLMDLVHEITFKTGEAFFSGCKLASLVYVMQFYFNKFSYRFRYGCGSDSIEQKIPNNQNGRSPIYLNNTLNELKRMPDDDSAWDDVKWHAFLDHLSHSGFNAEVGPEQAEIVQRLRNQPLFDEDGDELILTRYQQLFNRLGVQDQGFNMYFCFYNNPTLDITETSRIAAFTLHIINTWRLNNHRGPARKAALEGKRGGRKRRKKRTRKRTKKKALKKKHRTRKRRKRRRRRGGGLSRKKCNILRHQHARLSKSLKTIKDALQVQCK